MGHVGVQAAVTEVHRRPPAKFHQVHRGRLPGPLGPKVQKVPAGEALHQVVAGAAGHHPQGGVFRPQQPPGHLVGGAVPAAGVKAQRLPLVQAALPPDVFRGLPWCGALVEDKIFPLEGLPDGRD